LAFLLGLVPLFSLLLHSSQIHCVSECGQAIWFFFSQWWVLHKVRSSSTPLHTPFLILYVHLIFSILQHLVSRAFSYLLFDGPCLWFIVCNVPYEFFHVLFPRL
jgi:hypothetical protein